MSLTEQMQALINYSNETTGESDTALSGYGDRSDIDFSTLIGSIS